MNLRALGVVVCVLVFTQNLREVSPSGNSQVPSVAALLTERIIVFPEVVDSGGYSTQLVLIDARGGPFSGSLQFVSRDGQPLRLLMR